MSENTIAYKGAFLIVLGLTAFSSGQTADSSAAVFGRAEVNAYDLQFYSPGWEDSLEYYKESAGEVYMPARFVYRASDGDSIVLDSIGVRYKGNSSYNFAKETPKKPFKFRFDKYRSGQRFLGMEKLNFSNCAADPSFMREKIAYDIAARYMPAPRAAFANISVEGRLIGLYTQVEQVDKIFLRRHFRDAGGNLFKAADNGATLQYRGQNQSAYAAEYDLQTNEKADDWSDLINLLDKLNGTAAPDFAKVVDGVLDFGIAIRHLALTTVLSHFDSYTGSGRNFYLYSDPASKRFNVIPWDLNMAFGAFTNNWNVITTDIVAISNLNQRPLNKRLLENDSLKRAYLDHVARMIAGAAHPDSVAAAADALKPLLDPHVLADTNKLFSYEHFLANIGEDVIIQDGPRRTVIPGIKAFATQRTASIAGQLARNSGIRRGTGRDAGAFVGVSSPGAGGPVRIRFAAPQGAHNVRIRIFDRQGRFVATVLDAAALPGERECRWEPASSAPGFYTVRMEAGPHAVSVGAVILK